MEEEKIKKKKKRLNKETVNIIRTAMRNNIELTNIADNKASVLLSINTLIITLLVPVALINAETWYPANNFGNNIYCYHLLIGAGIDPTWFWRKKNQIQRA